MSTYWFTVASGRKYAEIAGTLARSCRWHGIELDVLESPDEDAMKAKHRKIEGILNAPETSDRIVFLDADTIVLNPSGMDAVNGSWRFPWKIPMESSIPKGLNSILYGEKLVRFYLENGLSEFAPGGELEGVEWNSGVIAGDRKPMLELAREWAFRWQQVLDVFDGSFRRDQVSYRLAYWRVFAQKYRFSGLPAEYNWCASYFGINPNANILHRNMIKGLPWLDRAWNGLSSSLESGIPAGTVNRSFDLGGVLKTKPCLTREQCTHFNPETAVNRLHQTIRLVRPKDILAIGLSQGCAPVAESLDAVGISYAIADSMYDVTDLLKNRAWDLIIFESLEYLARVKDLLTAGEPAGAGESHDLGEPVEPGESHVLSKSAEAGESHVLSKSAEAGESHVLGKPAEPGESHVLGEPAEPGKSHVLSESAEAVDAPALSESPPLGRTFVGSFFYAHHLEFYETLFEFKYVRFIDESFGIFSNSAAIMGLNYEESQASGVF